MPPKIEPKPTAPHHDRGGRTSADRRWPIMTSIMGYSSRILTWGIAGDLYYVIVDSRSSVVDL
jgi:hypothetical protein